MAIKKESLKGLHSEAMMKTVRNTGVVLLAVTGRGHGDMRAA